MTDTLRVKYLDSKDMTRQATENYTKIVHTIEPVTLHLWEQEILLAEENRVKSENARANSYLIIKDTDDPIVQMFKQFVNWLRWATFYGISVIYVVIAVIVVLYGLVML